MKSAHARAPLPLGPLLHAYSAGGPPVLTEMHKAPVLGPRFEAVLGASSRLLSGGFLDEAAPGQLLSGLARFHDAVVPVPLHAATLAARAGFLRHAVGFLLRGEGSWPTKMQACLERGGPYRVPGLGPAFWSAVAQGTSPARLPAWTPLTWAGLERLGLAPLGRAVNFAGRYSALIDAHARIRRLSPGLSALHIDHFLSLVGQMKGRTLPGALEGDPVPAALAAVRQAGLRRRLKERGQQVARAQERLREALASDDGKALGDALTQADPDGSARCALDWGRHAKTLLRWARELGGAGDVYAAVEGLHAAALPGAGPWLAAAVLHLRDPMAFAPYGEPMRRAHLALDDGVLAEDGPALQYRLFNEACAALRERHAMHPLELPFVLARLGEAPDEEEAGAGGFCPDTFAFLDELGKSNSRAWMDGQRARYRFAVREPLRELCRELATRYVEPVLVGRFGWEVDTKAAPGHALTSICKNSYGRGGPYSSEMWITFCRPGRAGAQLFVRVGPSGVRYGLRLGAGAREDRERLQRAVSRHAALVWRLLRERGATAALQFGQADQPETMAELPGVEGLLAWASSRAPEASAAGEGVADEVVAAFDRLLPLAACCHEEDAGAALRQLAGEAPEAYAEADFLRDTFLPAEWLARARELLKLKKQLVLEGVPGTGKTHVARCLARLLAGEEAVRLVQFHPAYSYEEFVEGIKVRTVPVGGRHEVTYPVEPGLLVEFAEKAAASPTLPHVLVIDEINRGNLPRIFGELLFLLEYRGSAVELPCSRRRFALPENLYLVGTMNAADRSIAPVDAAMRRRFSFITMQPDAEVLTAWLAASPPEAGPAFASRVLGVFSRLNTRLKADVGPHAQIGHSYFMVPGLDEGRLRLVWQHHVVPLLTELCAAQPGRAEALAQLIEPPRKAPAP